MSVDKRWHLAHEDGREWTEEEQEELAESLSLGERIELGTNLVFSALLAEAMEMTVETEDPDMVVVWDG